MAVDASDNVYVTDYNNNAVYEIPAGGTGTQASIGSGFSNPAGIWVDAAGNIYVANHGNGAIMKIPAGSSNPITLGTVSGAQGVAVDGSGNVYVATGSGATIMMIPIGGTGTPLSLIHI